jgi:predicted ATPase/class 3 adenylate cyclase
MRPELPTGTVTFLFTDIEGSTRLLHTLGPDAYGEALAEHRRLLREAFANHGGVEIDTQGDAFFVAFPTASGAAGAARTGHTVLADGPVRVRIGLHTGVPTLADGGYVGTDVHRGARIAALAHGGQTIVSPTTAALLDGAELLDLGAHRLKDFDGAVRLFQDGEGSFPPVRTPGSVDLPTPATPFVGRESELFDAVAIALGRDPRVLTIVGPGGTGKTRFAIELARLLAEEAEGGTVFVPFAPISDPGLVLPAVAQALGASAASSESIAGALRGRRTHLVLDNLEHLLPGAADAVASSLAAAPELRLLVTSRETLRVQGEEEFDLPPLVEDEAVELFMARTRAVRPDVQSTAAVNELCRRLDRLPLAVELAAARAKLLSPEALLERLGGRLDVLRGTRDADPRHATLRATIGWSYELLSPTEQRLFGQLSVFAAGCVLESAEAVCKADLAELESLLDKSLLRRRTGRLGEDRVFMLETIREFAAERLGETGEAETVRRRHAERMLAIAESAHLSPETGVGENPQRHELVLAERDDVRAAIDWATEHAADLALELVLALENFWAAQWTDEGGRRLDAVVDRAGRLPPEVGARVLRLQGNHAAIAGDYELGIRRHEESAAVFRALGEDRRAVEVTTRLAAHLLNSGDVAGARETAQRSLGVARMLDSPYVEAQALGIIASASRSEGQLDAAWEDTRRSADLAAECGFQWWQGRMLADLLEVGLDLGRLDEGEEAGREALRLSLAIEDRLLMLWTLTGLARVELERGKLERAGRIWGAVAYEAERDAISAEGLGEFAGPTRDDGRICVPVRSGAGPRRRARCRPRTRPRPAR